MLNIIHSAPRLIRERQTILQEIRGKGSSGQFSAVEITWPLNICKEAQSSSQVNTLFTCQICNNLQGQE